tara:strand:+ start:34584 stop:35534 length:951 start_codon:yes stop_codon:yes gene_type:complete
MSGSKTNKAKKGKPKMFLLFLFVTTFIWFISKFSREYTSNLEAEIHYINAPHGVIVSEKNYDLVTFDFTTSGFDFLYYKINKPIVTIDLQKYIKEGASSFIISTSEFKKIITSQLKNDIIVNYVSIEKMEILLDKLKTKKVKVSLSENIQFKNGFKSIGEYEISPDSIAISGPTQYLDTLTEIKTELLELTNVNENIATLVNLNISNDTSISYSQERVKLVISVKEFTQKSLLVPVVVNNLPPDLSIKLVPENVTIRFDVSMEDYNKITANDFMVMCDFDKTNDQEDFMIPHLMKQPASIINLEIQENKINYLIFK